MNFYATKTLKNSFIYSNFQKTQIFNKQKMEEQVIQKNIVMVIIQPQFMKIMPQQMVQVVLVIVVLQII